MRTTGVLALVSLAGLAACVPAKYPPISQAEFDGKAQACIAGFPTDPDDPVRQYLAGGKHYDLEQISGKELSTSQAKDPRGAQDPKVGSDSTVKWHPTSTEPYQNDVARDPCASLYHELYHAAKNRKGLDSNDKCAGTKIDADEFDAVAAENAYRQFKNIKDRRSKYQGEALPPKCERTPGKPNNTKHEDGCVECAGSDGDPHLYTFDRKFFSFQAVGEFVLVKGDGLEVQVRQQPFADSTTVSVNTAVAVDVAGQKRTIRGADHVEWPDGSALWVTPIGEYGLRVQVLLADARKGKVSGLLGNYDGDKDNDVDDEVYGAFADRWRVKSSLFDYEPGKNTDSYTDRGFPSKETTLADVPDREKAEQTCRAAGVTQQPFLDACVLDVGLTGKGDFATSAAATQKALRKPVPPADTKQDLRVSAPFDRQVTAAATDCYADGDQLTLLFYEADLELSVTVTRDFRGPGEYALGSILSNSGIVSLTSRNTGYVGASSADAGKVTVAADGKSGTIDVAVTDHVVAPVRVTGAWACKEVRAG